MFGKRSGILTAYTDSDYGDVCKTGNPYRVCFYDELRGGSLVI